MHNIKAIIFDFGGVILNIDFTKTNKAFTNLGVRNFSDMYSQKIANPLFQHLEVGKLNAVEFYDAFRRSSQLSLTDHQIRDAWNAMLLSYRKEALHTLKTIKLKYELYLLSNTNIIHHTEFNRIYHNEIKEGSLDDYFDKIYYSHEIGYRKPGKEAYEYVLKENNLSPSETLFIDDSIQNINGARAVGLETIFLKDGMEIEKLEL